MDSAVIEAITAVQLDDEGDRQRWFELMCGTYDELVATGALDWGRFTSSLTAGAMSAGLTGELVERFAEFMTAHDPSPLETVGHMHELRHVLSILYGQYVAVNVAAGAYDEKAWHGFLAEYGAHWNGDEASWSEFRTWFLYHAAERELADPGQAFVEYVESQSDKRVVFAEYGVDATPTGYDDTVWNAFLAEHGACWNGEDAAWEAFRTWFLYHAEQQKLGDPASGFITYAENQHDKRAVFAQYGISVPGVSAEPPSTAVNLSTYPEVRQGDSGEWVHYLNELLTLNGL
jgi:hypothetical protein